MTWLVLFLLLFSTPAQAGYLEYPPYYGSMFFEDAAVNVTVTDNHTYYPITSGFAAGPLKGFTFASASQLVYSGPQAKTVFIGWSMSLMSNQSDQTVEGAILVNGVEAEGTGNATRAKENGVVYSIGAQPYPVTLDTGDIVTLSCEKENGPAATFTVNHASVTILAQ